jgi:hypothetical protein
LRFNPRADLVSYREKFGFLFRPIQPEMWVEVRERFDDQAPLRDGHLLRRFFRIILSFLDALLVGKSQADVPP